MPGRFHRTRWRILAAVAILPAALAIASCGSSSKPKVGANGGSTPAVRGFKLADCMRKHGVTNFPDPDSSGRILLSSSSEINPKSPVFQAAQKTCFKLVPGSNPAATNANTAATERQFVAAAECMRKHGVPDFPDPTTGEPHGPGLAVTGDGVSFLVRASIDIQSPAFQHASLVCHLPGFGPGEPGRSSSN
jgi:hypothetical protein